MGGPAQFVICEVIPVKAWMFFLQTQVLGVSFGQVYELHIVLTLRQGAGY